MGKKRQGGGKVQDGLETRQKLFKPTDSESQGLKGRTYTVSMAVPGSVIENTQTVELATAVAGQIARTAAIFNIDEVVVIDDAPNAEPGTVSAGAAFLARILQFMETPQYLRRALIPMHQDLRLAGMLPPLDAPHHMRAAEWCRFREGLVVRSDGKLSYCDVGLDKEAVVEGSFPTKSRLTLEMGEKPRTRQYGSAGTEILQAKPVPLSEPREADGLYWGYTVRIATGLQGLMQESPFDGGYDLSLGTSEHGFKGAPHSLELKPFKHMLVAFGGVNGLEECLQNDQVLEETDPRKLFDVYINTCPTQGSRTIRTEEAVLISMSYLQTAISKYGE
eukprot:jgi/Tetstr1/444658/TSEL_032506.t1